MCLYPNLFYRRDQDEERIRTNSDDDDIIETTPEPVRRYPKRNRTPRQYLLRSEMPTAAKKRKFKPQPSNEGNKIDSIYSWYEWSDCEIAKRYDEERNFFPQPGPSNLNYYEDDNLRPIEPSKVAKTPTTKSILKRKGHRTFDTGDRKRSLRRTELRTLNEEKANSNTMPSCQVVLRREQFVEMEVDELGIAHRTRSRRNSKLTRENLAALVSSPGSVVSNKTEPAIRTRIHNLKKANGHETMLNKAGADNKKNFFFQFQNSN